MAIRRVIVEKKPGFQVEAEAIYEDLTLNLMIGTLEGLRFLNMYDMEGITAADYEAGKRLVFSEPPVDVCYDETFPMAEDEQAFAFMYLPGQYDQRADSAAQCMAVITGAERPQIRSVKVLVLKGGLNLEDVEKIKNYVINPVDSTEIPLEKPARLGETAPPPAAVPVLDGLIAKDEEEMAMLREKIGLAMSLEDFLFCQSYFREEKRDPTITEIKVLDTYWSDHCRHTTFMTVFEEVEFAAGPYMAPLQKDWQDYMADRAYVYAGKEVKSPCLMDMATIAMKSLKKQGKLEDLDESEEINACTIRIKVDTEAGEEDWLLLFKNETHNHPTEIEPFGGAATCLGGAIRDPLSGRAYVYQAMRITGAGDPRRPLDATLPGKLSQRKICKEAAHGYSSYGNQIGLATGKVAEIYDEAFIAKRMEIGAVIGAAPQKAVRRETPEEGDIVLLLGGRTGRDGLGGATGSSKEHTKESIHTSGAEVQKGNPPTERKIQRLFRDTEVTAMIKRCNDFGAGGVAVAVGELTDSLTIDLDKVPLKYDGLDGTEVAISESQERMAIVIAAKDEKKFKTKAKAENLECATIAQVTGDGRLKMQFKGQTVVDLSREFLNTGGVRQTCSVRVLPPVEAFPFEYIRDLRNKGNLEQSLLALSFDPNFASQKGLGEAFDSTIGAGSVLLPFGGIHQLTPAEGMAAHLPVPTGATKTTSLMAYGYNPKLAHWSPYHGGLYAVLEAITRLVAMGGDYRGARLTLQEYFEKLRKVPQRWGKPLAALLGAYRAQHELEIAAIGGKDSMSGSFQELDVPPTLVAFAVGIVNGDLVLSPEWKGPGHKLILLAPVYDENQLPDFTRQKRIYETVARLNREGKIASAIGIREGGVGEALMVSALGNAIGAKIYDVEIATLLTPLYGGILLEMVGEADFGSLDVMEIGETIAEKRIRYQEEDISLAPLVQSYLSTMAAVYPPFLHEPEADVYVRLWDQKAPVSAMYHGRPKVLIPVFPGTNCEYDTAEAFRLAGAEAETFVFCNQTPQELEESIGILAGKIRESQILMLPGGFSAGDEPEGAGKFIAAIFRNPELKEAVAAHLEKQNLILGICNGFQALVKLGLLPYGEIRDLKDGDPTLTFNRLGRHISAVVQTKVISTLSPWFHLAKPGDIHSVPVSHGEGRFFATEKQMWEMADKGQIATQYVNLKGLGTMVAPYNPNGSLWAVEGITSEDGLILGKMGHSERYREGLFKNVPGQYDQKLFLSGVKYFK